jgi:hypothetical protein
LSVVSKSFPYGPHTVTIETGEVARQAEGAVRVSMGDTVVLVTACAQQTAAPGRDFLPLTVNYVEKTYAAGRIPGGFFKRVGPCVQSYTPMRLGPPCPASLSVEKSSGEDSTVPRVVRPRGNSLVSTQGVRITGSIPVLPTPPGET